MYQRTRENDSRSRQWTRKTRPCWQTTITAMTATVTGSAEKDLFDMDLVDEEIAKGISYIYAEATNIDEIEYEDIKKAFLIRSFKKNKRNRLAQC